MFNLCPWHRESGSNNYCLFTWNIDQMIAQYKQYETNKFMFQKDKRLLVEHKIADEMRVLG